MSYARILVNGDGLLDHWPTLAPHHPRRSPAAREALVDRLTQYHDLLDTPFTIVFDDIDPFEEDESESADENAPPDMQVMFTQKRFGIGQALDRLVRRFRNAGEIRVVGHRGEAVPTPQEAQAVFDRFVQEVEAALLELENQVHNLNDKERADYRRAS